MAHMGHRTKDETNYIVNELKSYDFRLFEFAQK